MATSNFSNNVSFILAVLAFVLSQFINKKKFAKAVLDKNVEALVI